MLNFHKGICVTKIVKYKLKSTCRSGLLISALDSRARALCGVLGQDTSISQCLSPPKCTNGYRQIQCWGNATMDWHPIQGGVHVEII